MKRALIVVCCLALGMVTVHADIIAAWDVDGVDVADGTGIDEGVSPFAFTSPSLFTHITDAKLTLGTGVTPTTTASQYGYKVSTAEASLAAAITANIYLQVSVTVESGYQINFSDIAMNGSVSATGCDDVAFMSSIAGYTSGNELQSLSGRQASGTGGLDTDATGWGAPIDLSGGSYQGVTGTTTFRLYGWNSGGGSGLTYIRSLSGDDFEINGTVSAIPEPTTMALFGISLGAVALYRRRK